MPFPLKLTVLGSGTSVGVPTIGCHCRVCTSEDPRDNRMRPSVLVEFQDKYVLIDTTPDFRTQALRARIPRLDAVLFTHAHADHIMGLDDVRPFNFRQSGSIPIYGTGETLDAIRNCFRYIFAPERAQSHVPKIDARIIGTEPFDLFGLACVPVPVRHGNGAATGFRFGPLAYLTDHSEVPESSLALLEGLEVLFLDALRHKPHPTHSTVERSLGYVARLGPRRTFFTHLCHDLGHAVTEERLPNHVRLAYDGLEVEVTVDGN